MLHGYCCLLLMKVIVKTRNRKTRNLCVFFLGGQEISVLHGAEKEVFVAKEISTYLQELSIFSHCQ